MTHIFQQRGDQPNNAPYFSVGQTLQDIKDAGKAITNFGKSLVGLFRAAPSEAPRTAASLQTSPSPKNNYDTHTTNNSSIPKDGSKALAGNSTFDTLLLNARNVRNTGFRATEMRKPNVNEQTKPLNPPKFYVKGKENGNGAYKEKEIATQSKTKDTQVQTTPKVELSKERETEIKNVIQGILIRTNERGGVERRDEKIAALKDYRNLNEIPHDKFLQLFNEIPQFNSKLNGLNNMSIRKALEN